MQWMKAEEPCMHWNLQFLLRQVLKDYCNAIL